MDERSPRLVVPLVVYTSVELHFGQHPDFFMGEKRRSCQPKIMRLLSCGNYLQQRDLLCRVSRNRILLLISHRVFRL